MHRDFLLKNNVRLVQHDNKLEDKIYDLHEVYSDYYNQVYHDHPEDAESILIIHSRDHALIMIQDVRV